MTLYKLQFGYLFNRVSTWFLIVLAVVNIGGVINATDFWNPGLQDIDRMANLIQYWNETLTLTKFMLVSAAIFLNILGFYGSFSRYHVYFINGKKGKTKLVFAKIMAIITIEGLLWINAAVIIHLAGFYLTPFFCFDAGFLWALLGLFGQMVILGLVGALAIQILDSIFTGIIPLALFWMLAMNTTPTDPSSTLDLFRLRTFIPDPLLVNQVYVFESTIYRYGLVILVLVIFNLLVFTQKDLK